MKARRGKPRTRKEGDILEFWRENIFWYYPPPVLAI
jgi:hypothetical protein